MTEEGLRPDQSQVEAVEQLRGVEPTGEVHPVADLFPMMTDDELDDLAADIRENGLLHPIVLDENGVLIDGRNRLEACQRAEVEPVFSSLNGHDPREFIMSMNEGKRRNSTQGQKAMIAVEAYWEPVLCKLHKSQEKVAQKAGVDQARIADAVTVKRYTPLNVEPVRVGTKPLSIAVAEAREAKQQQEKHSAAIAELRAEDPELASRVLDRDIDLEEAQRIVQDRKARAREKEEKERQYLILQATQLDTALNFLDPRAIDPDERIARWLSIDPAVIGETADFSASRARRVADVLLRYARAKENEGNGTAQTES
jgi:ParB-like chromosome segregation protein Spo0J